MSKTVVILGGAYAGLHIAHYLLKNEKDVKVVLVSKVRHPARHRIFQRSGCMR